jgi:hypothetical protein
VVVVDVDVVIASEGLCELEGRTVREGRIDRNGDNAMMPSPTDYLDEYIFPYE